MKLLRCIGCSYVFNESELTDGYCVKCYTLNKYKNNPVWQSLKLINNATSYLLQCNPEHICNSKWNDTIIDIADSPVWKTIPKE